MGLGSTAKKLQELADAAEKLFRQLRDLRERVQGLEEDLETTADRVADMEAEQRRQRALVEALAEQEGVDVDEVLADAEAALDASGDAGAGGDDADAAESA